MRQASRRRWSEAALAVVAMAWLARPVQAQVTTASNLLTPTSIDGSGTNAINSTSQQLDNSAAEAAISSAVFTDYVLYPGLMSVIAAPGPVQNLAAASPSSSTLALSWSAPGYDGSLGNLQAGTSYFIESATSTTAAWSLTLAQIVIGTSAVSPGAAQAAVASGLMANTTTFLRIWTIDAQGDASALSNATTAATLAQPPAVGGQPFLAVNISSVQVSWTTLPASPSSSTCEGYEVDASTAPNFTGTILSSTTSNAAGSSLIVSGLFSNTTYYFRVGSLNWAALADFTAAGSTLTHVSVDVSPPAAVGNLSASTATATSASLAWSTPLDSDDNPLSGTYAIQYATWTGVAWSTSNAQVLLSTSNQPAGSGQTTLVTGLSPNTTYFFHLWTANGRPSWSSLSNGTTVAVLANQVSNIQTVALATGAATLGWTALPLSPSSATAEGYELDASSTNFGSLSPGGLVYSSVTANVTASTLTASGLDPNTTYYFRVGSLNWNNAPDYSSAVATATLANAPPGVAAPFLGIFASSATLAWAALPAAPSSATAEGYRLEASSTNFGALAPGGVVYSSATTSLLASTLTISGLSSDTTYYFRVAALNWEGTPNYATLGSTSTMAGPPQGPVVAQAYVSSATVSWAAPAGGAQGFSVLASSTNFGTLSPGGLVYSSVTANGSATSLTVMGLDSNTTYYFQAGALNWDSVANYATAGSTATLAKAVSRLASDYPGVFYSSASAGWAALPAVPSSATAEGYRLEASSTNFGALSPGGTVYSSSTANIAASTLTVTGLAPNTTYYFRVASLNWGSAPDYTVLSATSTLANPPVSASVLAVGINDISGQWSANADPSWTSYLLEFSTASNFTGTLFSSTTRNTSADVTGLAANTTYYGQVAAIGNNGALSAWASLGSTSTLAAPPGAGAPAFSPVYVSSLTANLTAGAPANPAGTLYLVQLSSFSNFSAVYSSSTRNLSATFTNLAPNTTYYGQAAAQNNGGTLTAFTALGSTATLAVPPGPVTSTYSAITAQGFTMIWSSGTAGTGYDPSGTTYVAQVSTAANFTGTITQSVVSGALSTSFGGLLSGTVYYARVEAVNYQGIPTTFTLYGSVTTLNSSAPVFLAGTFQYADSVGTYLASGVYTDTTTPKLQVQVQSNFAPGLSVADTPSHLALWHLDEGAGTTGQDASRHNLNLTLGGSPAPSWGAGELGTAVSFDGTQNFAVSANLAPTGWRNAAGTNQFSVGLWFKTSLAQGYLFQVANSNAAGATTFDGELAWDASSGNLDWEVTDNAAGAHVVSAASGYNDGTWHYAVGVLNASGAYLYVDGAQVGTPDNTVTSANASTYAGPTYGWVGAASAADASVSATRFSAASIDEVLITTVALTAQQVAAYYSLVSAQTHELGADQVDVSTKAGSSLTWTRLSTTTFAVTGVKGTTTAQVWTSTMAKQAPFLLQTASPGALTDQVMFLASSLDANLTTAQYTILVDTTPPAVPTYSSLASPTTFGLTVNGLSASDALSGLNALPYDAQASTDPAFGVINADPGWIAGPSQVYATLWPNTTYYVRAQARDAAGTQGNRSGFSSAQSLATLTVTPSTTPAALLGVFPSSATLGWIALPVLPSSSSAEGYELDASTAADFSGTVFSSSTPSVAASTLTVSGLAANTTYFFRVGSINWAGLVDYIALGSTSTLTNPPAANPPPFLGVFVSSLTAQWAALPASPQSASAEGYRLELSSTNFGAVAPGGLVYSSSTPNVAASTLTPTGLAPNTTYYARVASLNWDAAPDYTILAATSTWSNPPIGPSVSAVFVSSVAIAWTALPSSPQSATAEGYLVQASTAADFSGTILSSATTNIGLSTLTVTGLFSNTTYYFRVEAFNWNQIGNFVLAGSTLTSISVDVSPPAAVANLTASTNTTTTASLTWSTPFDADDNPLSGTYAIQYATWTGVSWSTSNAQVLISTSGQPAGSAQAAIVSGLAANTTYFFYMWTANGRPSWSSLSNGATVATLANPVASIQTVTLATGALTLGWRALPLSPSSATSEGYELDASSTNFGALSPGGLVYSSITANVAASTLTVTGLDPNTTYYFRVASLNWGQAPNYVTFGPLATLANPPTQAALLGVFYSSASAGWAALPAAPSSATAEGYRLEASSTNFGALSPGGTVYSSSTANIAASTLTVTGLSPNTTYYFRVASLNWGSAPDYTVLSATSTLANPPVSASVLAVGVGDISGQWSANADPSWTSYLLEFSTASNFTGTLFSSTTRNTSADVTGLAANTTYYGQVAAIGNNGTLSAWASLGSTSTLASAPGAGAPAFSPVYVSSLTANLTAGAPANPAGTLYVVQLSSFSNFSAVYSSSTRNLSATFTGLPPNTTYYGQAAAQNNGGTLTAFTALGSTATLAVPPGPVTSTYSAITANGFTMTWSSGTAATGYDPSGTTYVAQVSTAANFTGTVTQSAVSGALSTSFGGLLSGTLYYARVEAINYQGIPTAFTLYGSVSTLNSSKPTFIANSFAYADSVGTYLASGVYTDTTTPKLQVQVQSNFAPGLSVADTPSHLALWHLDEGAGATGQDASRHNFNLTLSGAPAPSWGAGELGSAVSFDGVQNFAVSANLAPTGWRNAAGNNQFSVGLWFKTSLAQGYLFQVANSNAAGAATFDGELAWDATSGNLDWEVTSGAGAASVISAASGYNDGAWHYAVGVLDTTGMSLYVDGALAASGAGVNSTGARVYAGPTYGWVGAASAADASVSATLFSAASVDEVLITTVALTAQQVAAYYSLVGAQTHELGADQVDVSTKAGASSTWTRLSTTTFAVTGTNGTTAAQVWTSTMSKQSPFLLQTASPGASTNQVMFLASSLDANLTTAQYTILVDTTPPAAPTYSSLASPTTFGLTVNGLSASDALSGLNALPYDAQASTDPAFGVINADPGWIAGPSQVYATLWPNTTYYVRAQARDAAGTQGNRSAWSSSQSLATLTVAPSTTPAALLGVFPSSATLGWIALPVLPSSSSAEGYELDASTAADFSGTVFSSSTPNVAASTLTVSGLAANTTYFFRVGSINWAGLVDYIALGSTSTLANPPAANPPPFLGVFVSSLTAQWAALPASPQSASAEGYRLELSSTNFGALATGGLVYSSATPNVAASTLTPTGLAPNTTYYARVASLNWDGARDYTVLGATSSLAVAVNQAQYYSVGRTSITVNWAALPGAPSSATAEGYELDLSSTNFGALSPGGVVYSSFTPNVALSTLTIAGLPTGTLFYGRVATFNWTGVPDYVSLGTAATRRRRPRLIVISP